MNFDEINSGNIRKANYTENRSGYRGEVIIDNPLTKRTLMKLLVGKSITFFLFF